MRRRPGRQTDAVGRNELDRLPIAQRDRAGLVEQQHVDIAGGFDRAARHGDDIGLDHAVHAGNADGREQAADRRRNQADQQRDQHRDRDRRSLSGRRRRCRCEKGNSVAQTNRKMIVMRGQQDVERDFVGRLLPLGPFDQGDHAVEERFARIGRDAHDEPVGQHACAAGDAAAVAAALADDRALSPVIALSSTEATPSITSPSAGNHSRRLPRSTTSPLRSCAADVGCVRCAVARLGELFGRDIAARCAQRIGLGLAAPFGHRLGEVGEQHREPQPGRDAEDEPRRASRFTDEGAESRAGREDAADIAR